MRRYPDLSVFIVTDDNGQATEKTPLRNILVYLDKRKNNGYVTKRREGVNVKSKYNLKFFCGYYSEQRLPPADEPTTHSFMRKRTTALGISYNNHYTANKRHPHLVLQNPIDNG